MAASAQSIDFKTVVLQLPTATKQANFTKLVYRVLGIAHYQGVDHDEWFDVTSKALKGCDSYYYEYKDQMSQVFDIRLNSRGTETYQALNGDGQCKQYRCKMQLTLADISFTDTKVNDKAIDFDFEPQLVEMSLSILKRVTIATSDKKMCLSVKTPFQANHYIKQFLKNSITPQYVANRIALNRDSKTYERENEIITIKGDIDEFLTQKVHAAQIAGGYILNEIRQSNFFNSISPTNGRNNTSATSLASVLMVKHLRLDGEKLKGLDICNSQFLIFAVMLKNCLNGGKMLDFLKSNEYMSEYVGKKPYFLQLGELIETLQNIVQKEKKGADFAEFIEKCERGCIYQDFAHRANITDRKAKQTFFHILFGGFKKTELSKKFKEFYPTIYSIVTKFKRATYFKYFSVMLQKIESLYFVKTIFPMCYNANIPCLTKHDSIFTTERNFKKMERLFNEVMTKNFNEHYTTKVEN